MLEDVHGGERGQKEGRSEKLRLGSTLSTEPEEVGLDPTMLGA